MNTIGYIGLALIALPIIAWSWRVTVQLPMRGIVPQSPASDEDVG